MACHKVLAIGLDGYDFSLAERYMAEGQMPALAELRKRSARFLLDEGLAQSVDQLAKRERIDRRSVRRLIRLGFLSPRIVEAIAEGRQPPDLSVIKLTRRIDLPLLWSAQEQALGIS